MVTVTFTRDAFLKRLDTAGLDNPEETYRMFGAVMDVDGGEWSETHQRRLRLGGQPVLSHRIQEEPELADRQFSPATAHVLGAQNSAGLAIQRVDLQHSVGEFPRYRQEHVARLSVEKAPASHAGHRESC